MFNVGLHEYELDNSIQILDKQKFFKLFKRCLKLANDALPLKNHNYWWDYQRGKPLETDLHQLDVNKHLNKFYYLQSRTFNNRYYLKRGWQIHQLIWFYYMQLDDDDWSKNADVFFSAIKYNAGYKANIEHFKETGRRKNFQSCNITKKEFNKLVKINNM